MLSMNSRFLVASALIALATLAMGLDEMDLKNQRGRPKPLAEALSLDENLIPRHADPDPSNSDRIETIDPQDLTTSLQNVVGSPSVTLPPVATGSTVHTGGVGGSPTTATVPTTTSGVLGPNTTGSVPSGGNVVPDTSSASASGSGGNTETQAATTSVSGSAAASASAGVSMSASITTRKTANVSSSSAATANQAGPSQLQSQGAAAADNVVGVGGVLGVVVVGIGWLL